MSRTWASSATFVVLAALTISSFNVAPTSAALQNPPRIRAPLSVFSSPVRAWERLGHQLNVLFPALAPDPDDDDVATAVDRVLSRTARARNVACRESSLGACPPRGDEPPRLSLVSRQDNDDDDSEGLGDDDDDAEPATFGTDGDPDVLPVTDFRGPCGGGMAITNETCLCPLDLVGDTCNYRRITECAVARVQPACTNLAATVAARWKYSGALDGDPPCLAYDFPGAAGADAEPLALNFTFRLACRLRGEPQTVPDEVYGTEHEARLNQTNRGFDYFAVRVPEGVENATEADVFVASRDLRNVFELRAVNWSAPFSDNTFYGQEVVSHEQLSGEATIAAPVLLPPSVVEPGSGYVEGGRVYMEGRMKSKRFITRRCLRCTERIFVDVIGYRSPRKQAAHVLSSSFPTWAAVLTGLVVTGLLVGAAVSALRVVRRRRAAKKVE